MVRPLKHILCIDDDSAFLAAAKLALETIGGYQVSTCDSGKEALQYIDEIKPDMILLDVMMPGLDGPTVFSKLNSRGELKPIRVVFMTAKTQPEEIAHYSRLGAAGIISKPFDPMKLSEEIESLWQASHSL